MLSLVGYPCQENVQHNIIIMNYKKNRNQETVSIVIELESSAPAFKEGLRNYFRLKETKETCYKYKLDAFATVRMIETTCET